MSLKAINREELQPVLKVLEEANLKGIRSGLSEKMPPSELDSRILDVQ